MIEIWYNTYTYTDGMVIYIWWKSWWWLLPASVLLAAIVLSQPSICRDGQWGLPPVLLRDSRAPGPPTVTVAIARVIHTVSRLNGLTRSHLITSVARSSSQWEISDRSGLTSVKYFRSSHKSFCCCPVMSCCRPVRYSRRISQICQF